MLPNPFGNPAIELFNRSNSFDTKSRIKSPPKQTKSIWARFNLLKTKNNSILLLTSI